MSDLARRRTQVFGLVMTLWRVTQGGCAAMRPTASAAHSAMQPPASMPNMPATCITSDLCNPFSLSAVECHIVVNAMPKKQLAMHATALGTLQMGYQGGCDVLLDSLKQLLL